ncbi:TOM1-like protein [Vigna angularis]|uniref:TOM1-like protein n=1 Tax=Phaseolus angularis TaxID=3914 RepID=A0A8T0KYR3_PHAAN|nr:TOM1-like protein [Vigna angularis]
MVHYRDVGFEISGGGRRWKRVCVTIYGEEVLGGYGDSGFSRSASEEAFGGSGGKHPQYYRACKELKLTGLEIFSMPSLDSMRYALDLLSDMLQAANPSDRAAVKEEVIIDLVDRCRTNQKKLMQMLTTTGDEELLGQGLELNDITQSLLARHDAIASGTPFPIQGASSNTVPNEAQCSLDQSNICSSSPGKSSSSPKATYPGIVFSDTRSQSDDEEDEFAQLLRRLFEDLNVFGDTNGKVKMTSSSGSSSNLSGTMGPGMVGGLFGSGSRSFID